jgi:Protein of unknown function (DUF3429)
VRITSRCQGEDCPPQEHSTAFLKRAHGVRRGSRGIITTVITEKTPGIATFSPLAPVLEWASYACVALLVLGLAGVGLLPDYGTRALAQRATLAWGGVLLGFTGAVHWGLALASRLPWRGAWIAMALAPAACAGAAVVIGGQRGLALLTVGFGMFWLYEHRVLGAQLPPAYLTLRRQLSVAICVLLAVTMFISDANGLP